MPAGRQGGKASRGALLLPRVYYFTECRLILRHKLPLLTSRVLPSSDHCSPRGTLIVSAPSWDGAVSVLSSGKTTFHSAGVSLLAHRVFCLPLLVLQSNFSHFNEHQSLFSSLLSFIFSSNLRSVGTKQQF